MEKKIIKKLILKNKDNYNFSLSNNQLSYRRNKTTFSSNSTLSNRNKVPSYDFQYTKTTSKILPKIKKSNSKKINHTNLTFTKYNNINLDFLSRKDLYYSYYIRSIKFKILIFFIINYKYVNNISLFNKIQLNLNSFNNVKL